MSLRRAGSIFDKSLKRTFNQTKYANLTARTVEGYNHLTFYSWQDVRFGRFMLTFGLTVTACIMYYEPGWFHETLGHFDSPPNYDTIDSALDSQERKLNRQVLKREEGEHKLQAFMDIFKNYAS